MGIFERRGVFEVFLRCFRGVWKLGYIGFACFCGILMYFTMICAEIRFRWKYVATRVAYFDRFRGMDTSGLLDFVEFRCILFWDTSESDVFDASRCI